MNVQIRRFVTGPLETNSYLVTDTEGHALVFDPSSGCGAVIDECGRLEVSPAAVILTHGHFDHCMGLAEMTKAFPAAAVYIHPADLFMLRQAQMNGSYLIGEPFAWDGPVRELPEGAVTIGGFAMEVTRCPGHSPGGCIVRFGDQCITGDVIFAGSIGRSDFAGGDAEALLAGIRGHILTLPAETVLWPGHGGRTTAGREKRMNPFLQP